MLDLKLIREDPDAVRAALSRRGGSYPIDAVLEADARRRSAQARIDELRAERKQGDKRIAALQGAEKTAELARLKSLSDEIAALEAEEAVAAAELSHMLLEIPNIPHESVPPGTSDDDNVELYRVGEPTEFAFEARDHLDIGEALGIIDVERGARTSGSRFAYLKGAGALLWLSLSRYVLDHLPPIGDAGRTQLRLYRGGHMFYLDAASRRAFSSEARAYYQAP